MTLGDEYHAELQRKRAAEKEAAEQQDQEERQREVGLQLARQIDEVIVRPFVRAANSPAGHAASKPHLYPSWLATPDPMIPKSYEREIKTGLPWKRRSQIERTGVRQWVMRIATGGELVIVEHGWWEYATYEHEYDGPTRTTFSIGRRRDWNSPENSQLYSSPVQNGEALFGFIKQSVAGFMIQHGIEFRG